MLKSFFLLFSSQGISFGTSLLSTVLLGKSLGVQAMGDYGIYLSIQAFLLILTNPLQAAGIHFLNRSEESLQKFQGSLLLMRFLFCLLAFGILLVTVPLLSPLIEQKESMTLVFLFLASNLLFYNVERHLLQLHQAKEDYTKYAILSFLPRLFKLSAFAVLFYFGELHLKGVFISIAFSGLLAILPFWREASFELNHEKMGVLLKYCRVNFLSEAIVWGGQKMLILFIVARYGNANAGFWSWAEIVLAVFLLVGQVVNTLLIKRVFKSRENEKKQEWFWVANLYVVLGVAFFFLGPLSIEMVFGSKYSGAMPLIKGMLPGAIFFLISSYSILFFHKCGRMLEILWYELVHTIGLLFALLLVQPESPLLVAYLYSFSRFVQMVYLMIRVRQSKKKSLLNLQTL